VVFGSFFFFSSEKKKQKILGEKNALRKGKHPLPHFYFPSLFDLKNQTAQAPNPLLAAHGFPFNSTFVLNFLLWKKWFWKTSKTTFFNQVKIVS